MQKVLYQSCQIVVLEAYGGGKSSLKIVSQLSSTSGRFDSSILQEGSCKGKIQQWLKVL